MIRVLVSLSSIVSLIAADRAAAGMCLPVEAPTPPAINCEQPANTTAAPAPAAEGDKSDMRSFMRQFATYTETLSQMEAWWRERSKFGYATQDKPTPSTMKEPLAQMDAWWQQRAELGHVPGKKPAPAVHHRRHRQPSALLPSTPPVEYGCPPSVCTIQYDKQ
jgi:hypothetical protein